ncbi:TorF family putative porin [Abyssibacter sp.]|jgi:uncharacterized protein (TIGR02001 family)|uniref:TorF family putative porin n=1 Tax=Abyssibacter sp. TaxID=2320200 RepID=UPI003514C092
MEFKRSVISAAVLGATVFSGSALAGTSVNLSVTSDYLFRGLPQSGGAAVQGGIDYAADSGFYLGAWASTIGFGGDGGGAGSEVDLYMGFGGEAGAVGYDFGAIYYLYTEEDEVDMPDPSYNTIEVYGSLAIGMFSVGAYFAPDTYFGVDDTAYGVSLGFSAPISDMASFDASIQQNGGEGNEAFTPDGDAYIDYSFGISAESESGLSVGLAFVGTDIDDDDPKLIVSGGYAFDI